MLGNVSEWCEDAPSRYEGGAGEELVNPPAAKAKNASSYRVLRGGSWYYFARHARAAANEAYHPSERYDFLGFRVARGASGSSVRG
jgi:formylglycine-generating enzyme required for sulfatase activity